MFYKSLRPRCWLLACLVVALLFHAKITRVYAAQEDPFDNPGQLASLTQENPLPRPKKIKLIYPANSEPNKLSSNEKGNKDGLPAKRPKNLDKYSTANLEGVAQHLHKLKFAWPSVEKARRGSITKNIHGIDIEVPQKSSVKAAAPGIVIFAGDGPKQFRKLVLVKHDLDYITAYGFNSKLLVKRGDRVVAGQVVARSGLSSQDHQSLIHFEIRKGIEPLDPMYFLE